METPKALYVANTSWYLANHRLSLLRRMLARGWEVVAAAPPDEYSSILVEAGIRFVPLPIRRKAMNPFADLRLLLRLLLLYAQERPLLVHHFTIKPVLFGTLAARLTGIPARVASVTGLGYVFTSPSYTAAFARSIAMFLYRCVLRGPGLRVIFQNADDHDFFLAARLTEAGTARIVKGSGVDTELFSPALGDPTERCVILYAGRMLWDKGVGDLVSASRELASRGVALQIVLAGAIDEGNPAAINRDTLLQWENEGVVKWIGHHADMAALMKSVDAVVLPSYREGLPRALIEGAACGKPLIATDVPGCRDVVRHQSNGFLVPAHDTVQLAIAIERLVAEPELRKRMGAESRALAVKEFSVNRILDDTLNIYSELIPERFASISFPTRSDAAILDTHGSSFQ